MLGLMLHAHPRIAIPPEHRFLLPVYFGRREFGDLDDSRCRRKLAKMIVGSREGRDLADLGLDANEITERIAKDGSTVGAALGIVLRAYADRFDKVRWGDKRPGYHSYVWVIQRMFPDAQFINLVRDGRDAVASMKKSLPHEYGTTYRRAQAWVEAIEHGAEARRQLRSDSFYELQYEHLVNEPEKHLTALCDFLGEPFDEAMLSPEAVAAQVVPERKQHHSRTRQEVSGTSVGNFRGGLERWEVELCDAVMREHLEAYGYELSGADAPAEEHLEEYRQVVEKRHRQLEKERNKDLAVVDRQPVADTPAVGSYRERITVLEGNVATLEDQVRTITSDRNAQKAQLDRMFRSRAWRLTKPLRKARQIASRRRS